MNQPEFCAYPPRLAVDVEISPRSDGDVPSFIVGSPEVGRYLSLGVAEHRVIQLLDGTAAPAAICSGMERLHGAHLQLATLARFLTKLDAVGILAGERKCAAQTVFPGNQAYLRWTLFNPDRLFSRLLPAFRWIWTPAFFAASLLLIAVSAAVALANWAEIVSYGGQLLRERYVTVLTVAWIVVMSHEFAHGMTAKAFSGRATEVGALLIYYCLPALYCNVSGLYLIPQRRRRLWVIAAGVYWQLLVGASALLAWFLLAPHTWPADIAMIFVLGSFLDVVFNANPLIKLDGYYFLSQWLRLPNLMDRSHAYWRGLILGDPKTESSCETARLTARERRIFLVFGLLSFAYNLALPLTIFWFASQYLMDQFRLPGFLLSILLGLAYARGSLKGLIRVAAAWTFQRKQSVSEGNVATNEATKAFGQLGGRRRLVPAGLVVFAAILFCIPWTASVGSYGALMARPDHEATIRAPENGSVVSLSVRPGQQVKQGMALGRLGNLDLEEQIVQVQAEFARVNTESELLSGELRVQQQEAVSAKLRAKQRWREFNEVEAEEQQISARVRTGSEAGKRLVAFSTGASGALGAAASEAAQFPAILAALEAKVDMRRAKLAEADTRLQRSRRLFAEGIMARSELDAADTNASTLASDLAEARQRLDAALIDHGRRYGRARSELNLSHSSAVTVRAQITTLQAQLQAMHQLAASLQERLALLERKRSAFALAAPVSGTVFGEDLPRMSGRYLLKGTEICRIADVRDLLVRVQVPEHEIGDLSVGNPVRLKARAFPNRVFHGVVSRISAESDLDQSRQTTYRVELTIRNDDGLLRPGMTVFARIDFGRHIVAWILVHKFKQALRPEMWML